MRGATAVEPRRWIDEKMAGRGNLSEPAEIPASWVNLVLCNSERFRS
jgi:hypothetical protein